MAANCPVIKTKAQLLCKNPCFYQKTQCKNVILEKNITEQLCINEVFELDLVTDGNGVCQIFGQAIPCKKGDIFVIPPDVPHNCFLTDSDCTMEISRLFFDVRDWFKGSAADVGNENYCYGIFGSGTVIAYATLNLSAYEKITKVVDEIAREITEKSPNWQESAGALFKTLFITLGRYIGKATHNTIDASRQWHNACVADRMVMENFSDTKLSLQSIADTLYISKSYLSRQFKSFTGQTFCDYLREVRLNHAARLLKQTDMTVEQIAKACGLRDVYTFYKNFQSLFGTTPNKYRLKLKHNKEGEKIMLILSDISEKMQQGRGKQVAELVQQALNEGCDPEKILNEGLLSGMNIIGEKFKNNEIYVPEVLVSVRAMNMGTQILKPLLGNGASRVIGKVCLGTVQGDLHDIGKNLVKMIMEGKGLEVIDLGTDVPPEAFIATTIEKDCDIICLSALLTTTMPVMAEVVKAAEKAGIRDKVKIMIGGAPVSDEFCKQIGADCYTVDAASAADAAINFCQNK